VTATISPPVRIVAALGLLAAAGASVFFLFLGRPAEEPLAQPASVTRPTAPATQPATPAPAAPATIAPRPVAAPIVSKSGLPLAIDRALGSRKVVVVSVYVPGAAIDAAVRKEARAGALGAGAAYLAIPTTNARMLGPLVAKTGVLPAPAVVIFKRPGVVATTFGFADRELVAQAVQQAKR
jgi:hypothetical protein